jgi:hypothetical protein
MALAVVQEFTGPAEDTSTTNYDAISEKLGAHANPPAGLILHTQASRHPASSGSSTYGNRKQIGSGSATSGSCPW